jgi:hypothetical protein
MTDRARLQHKCPACHAVAASPCVDRLGDATARPHRTRGPGQLERHLAAEAERKAARERTSYGPLFQDLAAAEVAVESVESIRWRKRFDAAHGAERLGPGVMLDPANRGLEWVRLHHIQRRIAERIGEWWAAELWERATTTYGSKADYILGFLAECMTSDRPKSIRFERRADPARATGINNEGYYLHDLVVWPALTLAAVPVMTREEFDAIAPVDHRRGLIDAPEPDDGGLFVRIMEGLGYES